MRRHELTDDFWGRLGPDLPLEKPATGRPNHDHRTIIKGIVWILRAGAPWRDLPERSGSWQTVYSRVHRWQKQGVWQRFLTDRQRDAAEDDRIGGTSTMIDRSTIRAHQHVAGARTKGAWRANVSVRAAAARGVRCTGRLSVMASRS